MHSIATRSLRTLFAAAAIFAVIGCASSGGDKPEEKTADSASLLSMGKTIKAINISYDETNLNPGVLAALKQFSVARKLDTQVRNAAQAISDNGTLTVEARVTNMRLRSTHSAIWLGSMAGADWISVAVEVFENGQSIKSFDTNTSTIYGGFSYGGRERRIDRMMLDLGKKIAKNI